MSQTVLVIDDDEMVADVVRIALTAEGFEVVHAPSTDAGLTVIDDRRPDLILLDASIPDAGTWSVIDRAHDGGDAIPVVLMAARTMPADQVRAYNLGATASITKPVLADDLVAAVRQVLAAG